MSPLLFIVVMEYLSRYLNLKVPNSFKFHKGCKDVRLNQLYFTDDLFIFCYGDVAFVSFLANALEHFERVSGLQVNEEKSVIYYSCV